LQGHQTFNFTTTSSGFTSIQVSPSLLVLVADTETATTFWSPTIATSAVDSNPYANFYQEGTNKTLLISGPYLVRNATLESSSLSIVGDVNRTTTKLLVYGGEEVQAVSWNGKSIDVTKNAWGAWEGTIVVEDEAAGVLEGGMDLPKLENWKYKDSLPEVKYGYDDVSLFSLLFLSSVFSGAQHELISSHRCSPSLSQSSWTVADHTETTNPFPPFDGSGPSILYANDYDYHAGNLLWRGAFEGSSQTGVNLSISGGCASSFLLVGFFPFLPFQVLKLTR
jgi:hypothetical protein